MEAIEGRKIELDIGSGTVKDVVFFISQIVQGVSGGHFSPRILLFTERFELFGQCCRALYWQHWDELLGRGKDQLTRPVVFLTAKRKDITVGAILIEINAANTGSVVVNIMDIVVDPAWRRRGIGSRLVQEAIDRAPLPSTVMCACTPSSLAMIELLKKFEFKLLAPAATVNGINTPNIFGYGKGT